MNEEEDDDGVYKIARWELKHPFSKKYVFRAFEITHGNKGQRRRSGTVWVSDNYRRLYSYLVANEITAVVYQRMDDNEIRYIGATEYERRNQKRLRVPGVRRHRGKQQGQPLPPVLRERS